MVAFAKNLAAERPEEVALRDPERTLSWADLDDALNRTANGLLAADLGPDHRIAVFAENAVETAIAHMGGLIGGASTVPVNFHLTAEEVAYILEDSGARMGDGRLHRLHAELVDERLHSWQGSFGGISVIDLETFSVARTVDTGPAPNYAIFTTNASKLYVSNAGDDTVSEIDADSWAVTRRIATGRSPEHVVLSADNGTLYVNNVGDGSVSIIPLTGDSAARIYQVGSAPHGIDLSDGGGTLFVSSQGDGKLVAIDLATGQMRHIDLAPAPYHVTSVPGSGVVFVSSRAENRIWVIDQSTLALRGEITIDGIGHQMAVAAR